MKVRISNKSSYRTDDLRKLVTLALKEEGMWVPGPSYYVVNIRDCKGDWCHGRGFIRHENFTLKIPTMHGATESWGGKPGDRKKYVDELPAVKVLQLAQVAVHEIAHNRGLNHQDGMCDWWNVDVPWAEGLVIRVAEAAKPKTKTLGEHVAARSANVDKRVDEVEQKLVLLGRRQKALKKRLTHWKAKQRYYAKAATPKPKD